MAGRMSVCDYNSQMTNDWTIWLRSLGKVKYKSRAHLKVGSLPMSSCIFCFFCSAVVTFILCVFSDFRVGDIISKPKTLDGIFSQENVSLPTADVDALSSATVNLKEVRF